MHWPLIAWLSAFLFIGCRPALEKQIVGEWLSGCSIDICTITTLRPDHTFSQRFDQKNLSDPVVSGTWRTEGNQLVLHITWQHELKRVPSAVGSDLRYIISDVQHDTFIATFAETKEGLYWRRRH
jgi:hypothetical protein